MRDILDGIKGIDDSYLAELRRTIDAETTRRSAESGAGRTEGNGASLSDIKVGMSAEDMARVRAEIARVAREIGR